MPTGSAWPADRGEDFGPFHDRIEAEARAGRGTVGVIGGEHGDMAGLAANDRLLDLSDLTQQLADRGFNEDFLELAKLGGDKPVYIPTTAPQGGRLAGVGGGAAR